MLIIGTPEGQVVIFATHIKSNPGSLARISGVLIEYSANIASSLIGVRIDPPQRIISSSFHPWCKVRAKSVPGPSLILKTRGPGAQSLILE